MNSVLLNPYLYILILLKHWNCFFIMNWFASCWAVYLFHVAQCRWMNLAFLEITNINQVQLKRKWLILTFFHLHSTYKKNNLTLIVNFLNLFRILWGKAKVIRIWFCLLRKLCHFERIRDPEILNWNIVLFFNAAHAKLPQSIRHSLEPLLRYYLFAIIGRSDMAGLFFNLKHE